MCGDWVFGLVMCQCSGNKYFFFQWCNFFFVGVDFCDDFGFQFCVIDILFNFIDYFLCQFLYVVGCYMFWEKCVLVIIGIGYYVDFCFVYYIKYKLCIVFYVMVGYFNYIMYVLGYQVVYFLVNECILIKVVVYVVFKVGEINMQMFMGEGVICWIKIYRVFFVNWREERKE